MKTTISRVRSAGRLSEQIYDEVYGDVDDKQHRAKTVIRIFDWLLEGEFKEGKGLEALAEDWKEFDVPDPAADGEEEE